MTERQQRAQELHGKGYNCAQSVACAYCDLVSTSRPPIRWPRASASAWA